MEIQYELVIGATQEWRLATYIWDMKEPNVVVYSYNSHDSEKDVHDDKSLCGWKYQQSAGYTRKGNTNLVSRVTKRPQGKETQ